MWSAPPPPQRSSYSTPSRPSSPKRREQLVRGEVAVALPLVRVRVDLLLDDLTDGRAEHVVLFGEPQHDGLQILVRRRRGTARTYPRPPSGA